ncbi:glycosyltransferase family 2 protein [Moraxella cuniculi]|uniref:glycosyltransferase family 2 protein n=1 Tax=Moraxella cuniculi TaxID=34061 RepID=UPI001473D30C|nr:glycosyltransferase family 2 protein [Moraxella cuniculi]
MLVVNYNTESYICDLLQDLLAQTLPTDQWQVVIVNNSRNDQLQIMVRRFQSLLSCTIIQSPQNVGFGRAMNLAAEHAQGELLLLMNPDMRMLQDDYLEKLLEHAQQNPEFGVISTQVLDDDGQDVSTYHYYEFGQTLGYDNQICWFQGSLMLMDADVFTKMGGFDTDFFMYCEDVDLCYRLKKSGKPLLKYEALKIYHYGGASEPSRGLDFYLKYFKSRWLFAHKHLTPADFQALLENQNHKAKNRVRFYGVLRLLSQHYVEKYNKNLATRIIITKIQTESADWLYQK